ncbi:MAG TPA: tetratricopeptide repeat protein [Chloroflexota bacterium]|nr:tetratricopeptide repeat protein [Chloroflexota bacterium]
MATDERSFGYLLRRYRLAALLTQEQLAERAHLSHRTISDLERGAKHSPRWDTVLLLADALELSPGERAALIAAAHPTDPRLHRAETQAGPEPARTVQHLPFQTRLLTFLVADLRGYTSFTEAEGDEAAARLSAQFGALALACADEYEGHLVETRGDEVLAAFPSAGQAMRAAAELQDRLAPSTGSESVSPLQAGIGLDAGEAVPVGTGYRGGALNLASRLCSLAGPGEIFASDTVVHLARRVPGLVSVDRGPVQLKGLREALRVNQIGREGQLPQELAPLQPMLITPPTNLPDDPTPFIGRDREIREVRALCAEPTIRLATLVGAGGSGKTRLALQVGSSLLHGFRDGVFFVALATVADPLLVPAAIADALELKEEAGRPHLATLKEHLKDKDLLLVLDNFEHLLAAASLVGELLDACRRLHILVTSRIPLHLTREHEYPVPPLPVPDPRHLPELNELRQYDAVALFIERARAVKPDFAVTSENAPAVAEICAQLDGLPLALELAAARIKLFPPEALLRRLRSRLTLLTGGARDKPARHQTMRAAIEWSYSLLPAAEQTLFARLSTFVGGCTLEAVEAVCNPDGNLDTLGGVTGLVDKSLLRQDGAAEPRFLMLETVREFATARLTERGEDTRLRIAHAEYFTTLAEAAEPEVIRGPQQAGWLRRLEREHDNLRAAFTWAQQSESDMELRLAVALLWFWSVHGQYTEGRVWLEAAATAGEERQENAILRAKALTAAGVLATEQGDNQRGKELLERALPLHREFEDHRWTWLAVLYLAGIAASHGEYERAEELFNGILAHSREQGNTRGMGIVLTNMGLMVAFRGEYDRAQELLDEALALRRALGEGQRYGVAFALDKLGFVALRQGDHQRAKVLYDEALGITRDLGERRTTAAELVGLAAVAAFEYEHERAARLLGAADTIWRDSAVAALEPYEREMVEHASQSARIALGDSVFQAAWEQGRAMSRDDALAYALGESTPSQALVARGEPWHT